MAAASWTVSVEDFGPINSTSVTLAPFVVFVGRNNSGKSYMAPLVWALLNAEDTLLTRMALIGFQGGEKSCAFNALPGMALAAVPYGC